MSITWRGVARIVVTVVLVLAAGFAARFLWHYYKVEPWTRNGRIRADVIQVAPDVTGLVTSVNVRDNQQVKQGDLLFVIDHPRFLLAREQAEANLHQIDVQISQASREHARNRRLGELASDEAREQSQMKLENLVASRRQLKAAFDLAELNLARTEVKAPVNGIVSNFELAQGDYATAGKPLFALINSASLRVEGYFEETKIEHVHEGDPVEVVLMGDSRVLQGKVESIAGGIEDRDNVSSPRMLANVNPTFNWVRLAQRIPVRVTLDQLPPDLKAIAGRTATVRILPPIAERRP